MIWTIFWMLGKEHGSHFQTYLSHRLPLNLRTVSGPGLASLFHVVGPQIPDFWCWRWWRPDVVFSRVFHISQLGSFQRYLSFLSFLHSFHSYIFSFQSALFYYHSFFARKNKILTPWFTNLLHFKWARAQNLGWHKQTVASVARALLFAKLPSAQAQRFVSPIRKQGPKNTTKSPQSYSTEFDCVCVCLHI